MILDELRQLEAARKCELITFNVNFVFPVAVFVAGATVPIQTSISADADFLWRFTTLVAYTGPGVLAVAPDLLLQFNDSGSGQNLQDAPTHVSNITGNGQLPYVLPEPYLFAAGSVVTATLTNAIAPSPAMTVNLTFNGYKVKYRQGYSRSR